MILWTKKLRDGCADENNRRAVTLPTSLYMPDLGYVSAQILVSILLTLVLAA